MSVNERASVPVYACMSKCARCFVMCMCVLLEVAAAEHKIQSSITTKHIHLHKGESIERIVTFQPPIPGPQYLSLTARTLTGRSFNLPATAFGVQPSLRLSHNKVRHVHLHTYIMYVLGSLCRTFNLPATAFGVQPSLRLLHNKVCLYVCSFLCVQLFICVLLCECGASVNDKTSLSVVLCNTFCC